MFSRSSLTVPWIGYQSVTVLVELEPSEFFLVTVRSLPPRPEYSPQTWALNTQNGMYCGEMNLTSRYLDARLGANMCLPHHSLTSCLTLSPEIITGATPSGFANESCLSSNTRFAPQYGQPMETVLPSALISAPQPGHWMTVSG